MLNPAGLGARLAALPREARDTLFLLGVIGFLVLPHIGHLPWWCPALTAVVLVWRGTLAIQARPLPRRGWRIALLLATLAATFVTHRTLTGRDAGVTLVVMLLALKTLELRARRDAFVVFFLGFFALLTNFFYSQSLAIALAMLLSLLGLLTALVNAHLPVGRPPLAQAARLAGAMALMGAPVMLALFLLFPRLAPLWGLPTDALLGRSGLSGTMRVGAIAEIALDGGIAARVRFEDAARVPPQRLLYFRGPVLSRFDGREWSAAESAASPAPPSAPGADLRVQGEPVRYQLTLEPTRRPWLLTLDATPQAPQAPGLRARQTADLQWLAAQPVSDLLRYRAQSYLAYQSGPWRFTPALRDALALPPGSNPRTRALAAQLRGDPAIARGGTPALVQAALARLRDGGYRYTLEPGVYGEHGADEFWFDRKQGFCEHIASAFAVLMRAAGVPARIVTGYQGGEANALDGDWTLRQSDAHAWTEVWEEGAGWVRVDPTGAVAPGRIGAFERLAAPAGGFAGALGAVSPPLMRHLRTAWEALGNGWNQWVLNYTQGRQLHLLRRIGFEAPSVRDLIGALLGLVVLASLGGAAWTLWERGQRDPWLRLLARARGRLARAGLALPDSTPPREMARRLQLRFGADAREVCDWLLQLEAQRYGRAAPRTLRPTLAALRARFRRLKWPA